MKGKILSCISLEAVHTHTHTSGFIEKEENKELWNKSQSISTKTRGITLVALVVTIVVDLVSYDRNKKYCNLVGFNL